MSRISILFPAWALFALAGCEGPTGPAGPAGADGVNGVDGSDGADGADGAAGADGADGGDGADGADGTDGDDGTDGEDGLDVGITTFHGADAMAALDMEESGKYIATTTITGATAAEDGTVSVTFTVADPEGTAVTGLTSINFMVASLEPEGTGDGSNHWVAYINRTQTVSGSADGDWPNPDGTAADQAYKESSGTLTDNGDGSYTYVAAANLTTATYPSTGEVIPYNRAYTHRVVITMGGHSGATSSAFLDFVPDGSAVTETRNIIETSTCENCHGPSFAAHGGDRTSIETCVVCHNEDTIDPQGGETIDLRQMIHKIHAGGEVQSIPGADGEVWDDPSTDEDETADNGEYAIWGYGDTKYEWWQVGFPAMAQNCTKCHTGAGEDVDNWKENPSRGACGSCHDTVDFATGAGHEGGDFADDSNCSLCHEAEDIWAYHDIDETAHERDTMEFEPTITVSTPANGLYFEDGESPIVYVSLTEDGVAVDMTTFDYDSSAEGCTETEDCANDGLFKTANLFVHGPRARRNPVLTTVARVEIESDGVGPWDLSSVDDFSLTLDGGEDIHTTLEILYADVTVDMDDTYFADVSAAEPQEIVDWLSGNEEFDARAIAYLNSSGEVSIRSRNLGYFFSLELAEGTLTDEVFAGDVEVKVVGGTYASNSVYDTTTDDPKVSWSTTQLSYQLDPVDDLAAGTYVVSIEFADGGRVGDTDYRTPTVGKVTFQVKQADEELPPAGNCDSCHQNADGQGLVFDQARHHKEFDQDAVDQCGACHDYQNRYATGEIFDGAHDISTRVHAVHYGSSLNYPLETVSHDDDPAGRYWDITYPQDVRYCETCHEEGTTSGSWATNAARFPCMGCHDSDAASAHMKLQTYDPTPENAWSGDEEESCTVCH